MPLTHVKRRSIYADKLLAHSSFVFSDHAAGDNRGQWRAFFNSRIGSTYNRRLILEIGCNDASLLTALAAENPGTGFVGLDWKAKALHDGASRIGGLGLSNVALLRGRGQDVLKMFSEGELDEIWIFHPDPCAGEKELRNRLFAEPFLVDAYAALGSNLCLKTDHPGYYQWACALFDLPPHPWFSTPDLGGAPRVRPRDLTPSSSLPAPSPVLKKLFSVTCRSADFWNDEPAQAHVSSRLFAGHSTPYESKFRRKRFPIYYMELRPALRKEPGVLPTLA